MYLVIDIGGTFTKYGYYDCSGHCHHKDKFQTITTDLSLFYSEIIKLITNETQGIAISMPGLINSQTGDIEAITLLPFIQGRNIINELFQKTKLPVSVENDAKCAALGEIWKGSLQNVNNGLMIVFGSGIGGTLILDGHIINSPRHKAGEIGSILMPLDMHYERMTNFGHEYNANQLIHAMSQEIGCQEDGYIVFQEIQKNPKAYHIFQNYCRKIAFLIYNLDYVLDLDVVSIGGGINEQDIFITTLQQQFQELRNQYQEDSHQPIIKAAHYKNDANLLGALYHHLQTYHQI